MPERLFPRSRGSWDSFSFKPLRRIQQMLDSTLQNPIIITAVAAAASFMLSPLSCRLAHRVGAMDMPVGSRRMHKKPIPRCGGLALFFVIVAFALAFDHTLLLSVTLGGGLIFLSGVLDDMYSLSPTIKLTFQGTAALTVLLIQNEYLLPPEPSYTTIITAFFFIVLTTNAFNLIDGLDELCSSVAAMSAFFIYLITEDLFALAISGAVLGFLPHNRHPAKMFLGDSGAMTLGFLVSVLSLRICATNQNPSSICAVAAFLFLPLADTLFAFLRRTAHGKSPFSPDRMHIHHRLVDSGLSHRRTARLLILVSAAFGWVGVSISKSGLSASTSLCIILLLSALLCLYVTLKKLRREL